MTTAERHRDEMNWQAAPPKLSGASLGGSSGLTYAYLGDAYQAQAPPTVARKGQTAKDAGFDRAALAGVFLSQKNAINLARVLKQDRDQPGLVRVWEEMKRYAKAVVPSIPQALFSRPRDLIYQVNVDFIKHYHSLMKTLAGPTMPVSVQRPIQAPKPRVDLRPQVSSTVSPQWQSSGPEPVTHSSGRLEDGRFIDSPTRSPFAPRTSFDDDFGNFIDSPSTTRTFSDAQPLTSAFATDPRGPPDPVMSQEDNGKWGTPCDPDNADQDDSSQDTPDAVIQDGQWGTPLSDDQEEPVGSRGPRGESPTEPTDAKEVLTDAVFAANEIETPTFLQEADPQESRIKSALIPTAVPEQGIIVTLTHHEEDAYEVSLALRAKDGHALKQVNALKGHVRLSSHNVTAGNCKFYFAEGDDPMHVITVPHAFYTIESLLKEVQDQMNSKSLLYRYKVSLVEASQGSRVRIEQVVLQGIRVKGFQLIFEQTPHSLSETLGFARKDYYGKDAYVGVKAPNLSSPSVLVMTGPHGSKASFVVTESDPCLYTLVQPGGGPVVLFNGKEHTDERLDEIGWTIQDAHGHTVEASTAQCQLLLHVIDTPNHSDEDPEIDRMTDRSPDLCAVDI